MARRPILALAAALLAGALLGAAPALALAAEAMGEPSQDSPPPPGHEKAPDLETAFPPSARPHTDLFPVVRRSVQEVMRGYIKSPQIIEAIDQYIVPPALGTRPGALGAIALAIDSIQEFKDTN